MLLRFSTIILLLGYVFAKSVNLNLLSLNDNNNNTRLGDTTDGVVYLNPELRVTTLDPIIAEPTKREADSNVTASSSDEEDVDFPTDDYDIKCDTEDMCLDHYGY